MNLILLSMMKRVSYVIIREPDRGESYSKSATAESAGNLEFRLAGKKNH